MRTKQNNNNKQIIIQNMKLYTIVLVAIANGPKKRSLRFTRRVKQIGCV